MQRLVQPPPWSQQNRNRRCKRAEVSTAKPKRQGRRVCLCLCQQKRPEPGINLRAVFPGSALRRGRCGRGKQRSGLTASSAKSWGVRRGGRLQAAADQSGGSRVNQGGDRNWGCENHSRGQTSRNTGNTLSRVCVCVCVLLAAHWLGAA